MIGSLQHWIHDHFRGALIGFIVLGCGLGLIARRVRIDQDVVGLLPGGRGSAREAAQLLGQFGALDTLLIDLELPGASVDELVDAGEALTQKLIESKYFSDVYHGPSTEDLIHFAEVLLPRRLYLLQDPALEIRKRLDPEKMIESLSVLRNELSSLQAVTFKKQLMNDPLGLTAELQRIAKTQRGDVDSYRGYLISQDRQHFLLVTNTRDPALNVDSSGRLLRWLEEQGRQLPPGPKGPAILRVAGGPRFASESAQIVKKDIVVTFVTSAVGLLALFFLRFRNLRLLLFASLPLAFGVLAGVAAVTLLRKEIHGLTLGFGSALIGIAIDYPIYLMNRAAADVGGARFPWIKALENVWRSLWLGWATTGLAFLALFLSPFPGLRELALFSGVGITAAFVATVTIVPALCHRWANQRTSLGFSWLLVRRRLAPRFIILLTVSALMASAFFLRFVQFDGDLRHLDVQNPQTLAEHQTIMNRLGQPETSSLSVVRASTSEEALQRNDEVYRALNVLVEKGKMAAVRSVAPVLPSVREQRARALTLQQLNIDDARSQLSRAAEEAGFTPNAFDGFWQEVEQVARGDVPLILPADLEQTFFAPLVRRAMRCDPKECLVVTPFQRNAGVSMSEVVEALPKDTYVFDAGEIGAKMLAQIPRQLTLLCGAGLLTNLLLLVVAYRSVREAFLACLPGIVGLFVTVGILGASRVPINMVSASGLVLVLGCGVDYGIFALQGLNAPREESTGIEFSGVLMASLSTLIGFGTLVLAQHRALFSMGVVVGIGILSSVLTALLILASFHAVLSPTRVSTS